LPELPEVETVRRGLEPVLSGARLTRVRANRPDLRFPLPDGFVQRLTGARILRLDRRAKYLLAPLDRGDTLVMHLGMTGRFEIASPGLDQAGRLRPRGQAGRQARPRRLRDRRGRGGHLLRPPALRVHGPDRHRPVDRHPWFATMGPEPLGDGFDAKTLVKAFANRKQGPKTLLLDQKTVAGLGNIYVCEALHRAHISPFKPSGMIAGKRLGPLTTAIKEVLAEAVEVGGSTLKDFAAADGALGYFQHRFRVYDREGEPCPTPGCKGVIAREVQAGRSTFFCPVCQV
jgi:formamidopyrimidine-DNA glycosylase